MLKFGEAHSSKTLAGRQGQEPLEADRTGGRRHIAVCDTCWSFLCVLLAGLRISIVTAFVSDQMKL